MPYHVDRETHLIDMDEVRSVAREHRPAMIVTGATAYPRAWDFAAFREIADEVGALLMTDMAHFAGLVAAGVHPSPIPHSDVVTTTTHKTLRGPRGGMILSREVHAKAIDKSVFPGIQGGPLMHVIAAKAVAFREAMSPEFRADQQATVDNARVLAASLADAGASIISGGTDNHLMLVDVRPLGVNGKEADAALGEVRITVNKNTIPYDPEKPMIGSGIRVGTPAVTSRGMREAEMRDIARRDRDRASRTRGDWDRAAFREIRRRGWRLLITDLLPLRRACRGRRASVARFGTRHVGDHHDAQDAARATRRHDPALRGPRRRRSTSAVFPAPQGGPLEHVDRRQGGRLPARP